MDPVFSYGSCPAGPQRLRKRDSNALIKINFGNFHLNKDYVVFADSDGVIFTLLKDIPDILREAELINNIERLQAEKIKTGKNLREQFRFNDYLKERSFNQSLTFRQYLRKIGGAIEE